MKKFHNYLEHILEEIDFIQRNIADNSKEKMLQDEVLKRAILRSLEIIGEAVKQLPSKIRDVYVTVPWKDIAGMRDMLIHHYFGVDFDIVWDVVMNELPILKESILDIKTSYPDSE
jgi:uncharacterized protein with HEPN domain